VEGSLFGDRITHSAVWDLSEPGSSVRVVVRLQDG
jgi:hypothetical protein